MILTVLMSKNVTTATVEPALATMEPIHRERMNCNINQIQKCQSNAAMQSLYLREENHAGDYCNVSPNAANLHKYTIIIVVTSQLVHMHVLKY